MLKWQYRTEVVNLFGQYRSKHEKLELESSKSERYEDTWTDINELGQEGWELSSTERYVHEGNGEYLVAFFKKQINEIEIKTGEISARKSPYNLNLETNIKIDPSRYK